MPIRPLPKYVIVSPVKDEERHVALTLQSVSAQSVTPACWIIVDDGSQDRTLPILEQHAAYHPYIRVIRHDNSGSRATGARVIRAFEHGRSVLGNIDYDVVVKLDCDLSFAPDYFQRLLERFANDERLGIASGVYLEQARNGAWRRVSMPAYHAFGACKAIRRECFEQIGGFVEAAGWDTVDEIKALSRGWRTCHFPDLQVKHHKPEGSGIGELRTSRMQGHIFYVTGGDPLFFLLKVAHRALTSPLSASAFALAQGYLSAAAARAPRLVTADEARGYRRLLRRRLMGRRTTWSFLTRELN